MTKEDRPEPRVDRRRFLQLAGTSAGVVVLPGVSAGDEEAFNALAQAAGDGPSGSVRLLRPRDLLNLEIDFLNLEPRPRFLDAPGLHAIDDSKPSFLVVTLPGQHLLEARTPAGEPAPPLPVAAFLSARTTLVFRVPHALLPLDYLIESLMRWQEFELVVRPPGWPMCEPRHETAIVFPSRLSFVPDEPAARVGTAHRPRILDGRAELWQARLDDTSLRAIWTPDHRDADCEEVAPEPAPPFDAPLQRPGDRRDIARSARRPTETNPNAAPVDVRRLALSPLGAWADVRGGWNPPASGDLVEWENRTTMGRDQRVKVARSGYLYPWGHKAVLVELTERKILPSPDGPDAAYLRYRFFLVITQPVRTYAHPDVSSDLAHPTQPLRALEFLTTESPTLDTWRPDAAAPAIPDGNVGAHGAGAFWPKVGGTEFRFAIEARDWTGRLSSTAVTGIFVGSEEARNGAVLADVERAYADETSSDTGTPVARPGLRTSAFRGQPVAYAVEGERDDTSLETVSMTFAGERRRGASPGDRNWPFSAVLASAAVRIPAVSQVAGYTQDLAVSYDERFEPAHPENNPAELFLKVDDVPHLDFTSLGADKAGGVATPNMRIGAVSRSNGPVGDDVDSVFLGEFEPSGFFPEDAKLLGGVKMGDVIDQSPVVTSIPFCDGSAGGARSAMPKFGVTYDVGDQDPGGGFEVSDRICFQLDWQTTKLKSFLPVFEIGSDTCLRLQATVCVGGDDAAEFKQQRGRVTDCKFTIPKVIRFHFRHVDFEHVSGRPLRVDVAFVEEDGVVLLDALKWIERMMAAIKQFVGGLFGGGDGGGIGDYFDYDISPRAVKLLLALKIPDVPMGALTLSNMRLGLGVEFPLLGSDGTLIIFEFSSRKSPFGITVPPFGGGGFFGIGFVTDELRRIEGAFEFGGRFELDILGAKGEAFVMVGIYYAMKVEDGNKRQELAAYLRAGGSLMIIKLIRVSVEFYMVLMYIADESGPDGNSLCGETTVKVEVSIAFFSAGVDLTFRKCFRGAEADQDPDSARSILPALVDTAVADSPGSSPKAFRDAVGGREGWREYWQAFAA